MALAVKLTGLGNLDLQVLICPIYEAIGHTSDTIEEGHETFFVDAALLMLC